MKVLRRRDLRPGAHASPASPATTRGSQLINDNQYGNGTAIFTRDGGAARQFQFDVQVGMVGINVPDPGAGQLLQLRRLEGEPVRRHPHVRPRRASTSSPAPRSSPVRWPDPAHRRPSTSASRRTADRMDFGVVLQTTPPSARVVDLAKRAERTGSATCGRSTATSCGRSRTSSTARSSAETRNVVVGPMVTNPATRDWTVTRQRRTPRSTRCTATAPCAASAAATPRCASPTARPTTLATLRDSDPRHPRARPTGAASTTRAPSCACRGRRSSELEVWVAAYGPKALALTGEVGDGFILQLADLSIAEWTIGAVRERGRRRRARPRRRHHLRRRARPTSPTARAEGLAHGRDQCRWFGGMVGNHVADIVARYGDDASPCPQALTDYIKGRQGYDYNEHGQAGNTHTAVRARRDRRPVLHRRPGRGARRADAAAEGARRRPVRRSTSSTTTRTTRSPAYGERVMPAVAEAVRASVTATQPSAVTATGRPLDAVAAARRRHRVATDELRVRRASGARCVDVPGRVRCSSPASGRATRRSVRRTAATCSACASCRAPSDRAMPHVWDDVRAGSTEPEVRGGDDDRSARWCSTATWYSFRVALAGFVVGTLARDRPRRADGAVPRRRAGARCRTSSSRRRCRSSCSGR